jgi:ATP-binding cassette subfamily F protein uup
MSVLLSAQKLSKTFGTKDLFTGVSLSLYERDRLALIGPNGSGKSTLLKILAGQQLCDEGQLTLRKGVRVAYVSQQDVFPEGSTVLSAVEVALVAAMKAGELAHMHDEHEAHLAAELALARHGLTNFDQSTSSLSGGQRKRLAIIRELAKEPDALLLDEPTNHLDYEGVEWLEETLRDGNFASAVVTHDREFLETVASRIAELSRQFPQGLFIVDGNYSEFLRRKQDFLDGQARQEQALANQVREDLRWLGRRAKARRTKSKSRIDASYERMDELAALRDRNASLQVTTIDWGATGRLTRKLLVARAITKQFGERKLFTDLDLVLSPGQRVGLMGPNGSGKSTLIKVLMGELEPDAPTPAAIAAAQRATDVPHGTPPPGTIKRAENLRIVLFSQHRSEIDQSQTLATALSPHSDGVVYRDKMLHINTWARKFLFNTQQLKQPVRALSGGEQARIHIARLMLEPADVLILDEPTNDLDIPSLEVLEESLEEFPGSVLLVTHDRAMLARLCTHFLALDGKGTAAHFADYEQWERAHEAAKDLEAREARAAAKANEAPRPAATQEPAPAAKKGKLSYKEQREMEQIEPAILQTESVVSELEAELARPEVTGDRKKLLEVSTKLSEAQAKVAELYERWATLEAKLQG